MSGSIILNTVDIEPCQTLGVVSAGGAVGFRMGDALFCSHDGRKWKRVHVVTRREARKNAMYFAPRVARYWRMTFYGRGK